MELTERLKKYILTEQEENPEADDNSTNEIYGMMVDLICSLDVDSLNDDQYELLGDILSNFGLLTPEQEDDEEDTEDDTEEETDELSEKKVQKIKRREHLQLHKMYKRNKAKFKMMNKKYRRSARYKMYVKKHKRMVKAGRTRKKKYV
jgi:hypothetical protein